MPPPPSHAITLNGPPPLATSGYDRVGHRVSRTLENGTASLHTYDDAGHLTALLHHRAGTTTTYTYDNAGQLGSISYSDTTPNVEFTYDRQGRQTTTAAGGLTTTHASHVSGQLLSESYTGGVLDGLSVTNGYDSLLRRSTLAALHTSSFILYNFTYDPASRLATVSSGPAIASYAYLANSPLVGQIASTQNGQPRMTTTKQYDALNRLTSISSGASASGTAFSSFTYDYNTANQRPRVTHTDGSYWLYNYDTLGQVTSGKHYWADGTPVAAPPLSCRRRRKETLTFPRPRSEPPHVGSHKARGNASGSNLRVETCTATAWNQYTQRTAPGLGEE